MTTRSKRAPDLVSSGTHGWRLLAATSRSSRWATVSGGDICGLGHLGQQGRRPSSTAPHLISGDPAISDLDDMGLVDGVRDAFLLPPTRELDELPGGQRGAFELLETPRVGVPAGQLGLYCGVTADAETPVRHSGVQSHVRA